MEPGPAAFFTDEQVRISTEPSLGSDIDRIEVGELAGVERDLATLETRLTEERAFLQSVAEDLKVHIDAVGRTLDDELAAPESTIPPGVAENVDEAQARIDAAESSFPADAYQEQPPWYEPPSTEIPTGETPAGGEPQP